jgi:hypothetical protein
VEFVGIRSILALTMIACGGRLLSADAGGPACAVALQCALPTILSTPKALNQFVDVSQDAVISIAATTCGFETVTLLDHVVRTSAVVASADGFTVDSPVVRGTDIDFFVGARDDDLLFVTSATEYLFTGPALKLSVSSGIPRAEYGIAGTAVHGDRILVLLINSSTYNTDPSAFWFEMSRTGAVTQPLARVHAPIGDARFDASEAEQLTEYSGGFAWVERSNSGNAVVVFSRGPGIFETHPLAVTTPEFSPVARWPYEDNAIAVFAHPSIVVRDDGTVLKSITETMPTTPYADTQWRHHAWSSELGLISAVRGAFNVIGPDGTTIASGSYDGGPDIASFIEPPPAIAVQGGIALFANGYGNVAAIGCP